MRDFLRAVRPANVLLVTAAQGLLLYRYHGISTENLTLLFLTSLWIIWGNIDNNVQDITLDTQYKRKKPNNFINSLFVSNRSTILERSVLLISLLITLFIGWKEVLYTLAVWSGLRSYNRYLKKFPLIGNFTIALLCAASLHLFRLDLPPYISIVTGLIFIATLLRELVKDKEDEYADKLSGYKTFAIVCPTNYFKFVLSIFGIILTMLALQYFHHQIYLLAIFLVTQFYQWYCIHAIQWKRASLMIKLQILIGVIGIGFI